MTLAPRLELRLQQRLGLTPEVRLRLSMLRMAPGDLDEALAQEAAANPFLRHRPRARLVLAAAEVLAAEPPALHEDLRGQLAMMRLPVPVARLAQALVAELTEDGLLAVDLPAFADARGVTPELAEAALTALQACDPPGIGARDAAECLRLQLVDCGLSADQAAATLAQLPALARQDWAGAGAALGLDPAATQARAALLRGLSPRPVLAPSQAAQALEPDLRAIRSPDGTVQVAPDSRTLPRLTLDAGMIRRAGAEGFGAEHLARAQAVMAALEQRQTTLARIGDWLARRQPAFFDQGPGALAPASQRDLAAALGLHPSTISRALAGKAVDVDGRLWPLAVFFSRALPAEGGAVSSRAVQKRLAEMVRAEDPAAPLSDDAIAEKLRQQGVDIARRTVAKYRQGLRIPPSSTRRRLAALRPTAGRGG